MEILLCVLCTVKGVSIRGLELFARQKMSVAPYRNNTGSHFSTITSSGCMASSNRILPMIRRNLWPILFERVGKISQLGMFTENVSCRNRE